MNKNREKHHPPEEAKPAAKITEQAHSTDSTSSLQAGSGQADIAPAHHEARAEAEAKPAPPAIALTDAQQLQKAQHEIEQLKDQLLRMRADYDNFRKRSLREKGEIYENANEALMLDLLPVLDHFQLAVKSVLRLRSGQAPTGTAHSTSSGQAGSPQADSGQAFQEGIQMIFDQLMDTLSKYGLVPFNAEKQIFDPKLHEAISSLPSATEPEGAILAQSRQGYLFRNKLLRPAQVVVSSGKAAPSQPATDNQPVED